MRLSKQHVLVCLLCLNLGLSAGAVTLDQAIQDQRPDQIISLLDAGLSPQTTIEHEGESFSLLDWAVMQGHQALGERLLAMGLSPHESGLGMPLVFLALETRQYALIPALIAKGADPNQLFQGRSALQQAVSQQAPREIIQRLLEQGADLELQDVNGNTALMIACGSGSVESIQQLLAQGARLQARNTQQLNCLDLAIGKGNRERVKWLLERDPSLLGSGEQVIRQLELSLLSNPVIFRDLQARLASPLTAAQASELLHQAIISKNLANLRRLLAAGADPNGLKNSPATSGAPSQTLSPLAVAIETQQPAMIQLLLSAGADPRQPGVLALAAKALNPAAPDESRALFELLLQKGADPNQPGPGGRTALMELAANGVYPLIDKLLARGVNVNARDTEGQTALLELLSAWASGPELKRVLAALLQKGADAQAANLQGDTPLMRATRSGRLDLQALILSKGPRLDAQNNQGQTALHQAILNQLPELSQVLLKRGAKPDLGNTQGQTPLMSAAAAGEIEQVRQLLAHGAQLTLRDRAGRWAYDYACPIPGKYDEQARRPTAEHDLPEQLAVRRLLLSRLKQASELKGRYSLALEARFGRPELALALLQKGADPQQPDPDGLTPLMAAASRGELELVKALLQKGAQPKASLHGYSVLHYAAGSNKPDVVRLLLDKGADPRVLTPGGASVLIEAAESGSLETVRLLLQKGLALKASNPSGDSVWLAAARSGNSALLTFLLSQGASLNEADQRGLTALHAAASSGREDLVDWLMTRKALVDPQDSLGRTPLMLAILNQSPATIERLLKLGANRQLKDHQGQSATDYAAASSPEIAQLFGLKSE